MTNIAHKKKTIIDLIIIFAISLFSITLFSYNSILYPMNNAVDVDCYYTMGLGLINGKIPYVDLFDHKGPLLYFVYALMVLMDKNGFIGGYIIEIVLYSLFIYWNYKICLLMSNKRKTSLFLVFLLSLLIVSSKSFVTGGTVEEINLPFFSWSLYIFTSKITANSEFSKKEICLVGIFAGIAFWTKYTLCSFYLGIAIYEIAYYLKQKKVEAIIEFIKNLLKGFFIISIPIITYLIFSRSFTSMFDIYFIKNIFVYGKLNNSKIHDMLWCTLNVLIDNYKYMVLCYLSLLFFLIKKEKNLLYLLLTIFVSMTVFLFSSGRYYDYYGLVFCIFSIYGIIESYQYLFTNNNKIVLYSKYILFILLLIVSIKDVNVSFMRKENNELAQYKFSNIINSKKESKILYYNDLDNGFYYVSNKTPTFRYFYTPNIEDSVFIDEQNRLIENNSIDYIISKVKYDFKDYEMILIVDNYVLYELCK